MQNANYVWYSGDPGTIVIGGQMKSFFENRTAPYSIHFDDGSVLECAPDDLAKDNRWRISTERVLCAYAHFPYGNEVIGAPNRHDEDVQAYLDKMPPSSNVVVLLSKSKWANFWPMDADPGEAIADYLMSEESGVKLSQLPAAMLEVMYRHFTGHPSGLVGKVLDEDQIQDLIAHQIATTNLVDKFREITPLDPKQREAFDVLFPGYAESIEKSAVLESVRHDAEEGRELEAP